MKQVYEFKDGGKEMVALLGGKGANLAEMAKIDLPIPKGIITFQCFFYRFVSKEISMHRETIYLVYLHIMPFGKRRQLPDNCPRWQTHGY